MCPATSRAAAVIFDLDGVLLDTEPLYTRASATIAAEFGKVFDYALKARIMGRSEEESAKILLTALAIPLTVEEYLARRERLLRPLFANAPAIPGAAEVIPWLHGRKVPLAVATSSARHLYSIKTSHHDWMGAFDAVICGDDPRVERPKPAPDIFLVAAQALAVPPSRCVVVEDSPAGMEAALSAGMQLVVLADPRTPLPALPETARVVSRHATATFIELGL